MTYRKGNECVPLLPELRLVREGSAAPAFVPNGKQTHKDQRRSGRERRTKGGQSGRRRYMLHRVMLYNLDSFPGGRYTFY